MDAIWTIIVYGMLVMTALGVIVGVGSFIAYIGECLFDWFVLPARARRAEAHTELLRSIPRRDLRRLPH